MVVVIMSTKITINNVLICLYFSFVLCNGDPTVPLMKDVTRVVYSTLGLAPRCNGCPARFCDDDPAIIHGYCCGCRRPYDKLPVHCSPLMRCPLNSHELCQQYEYMLHCCC